MVFIQYIWIATENLQLPNLYPMKSNLSVKGTWVWSYVPKLRGHEGCPASYDFFWTPPPHQTNDSHGALPLKSEAPFQITIPKKPPEKSTRTWFSHLEHLKLCKKSKTVCLKILHYLINWKRLIKKIDWLKKRNI